MSGGLSDRIVGAESGGDPTAKNPRSSATGAGQFIDSTWLDQVAKYRPDLAGLPRDQILALRNDPDISKEMVGHYADENGAKLRAAGLPDNDGTRYLSHFAGPGGAKAVLSADPSTPVVQVLQPGQVSANPFVRPMTAGQLVEWANGKVGGTAPTMKLPGASSAPASFGMAGPTQGAGPGTSLTAGGAAMQMPGKGGDLDIAALLKAVTAPGSTGGQGQALAAPAQAAPAPAAARTALDASRPATGFDSQRFFSLLPGYRPR